MIVETRWRATFEFSTLAEEDFTDPPEVTAQKAGQNTVLINVGAADVHVIADIPMAVSEVQENLPTGP